MPRSTSRLIPALPLLLLLSTSVLGACGEEEGPLMKPGQDCTASGCHGANGGGRGPRFTIAGTVFASPTASENDGLGGVTVQITDATSKSITLTTNSAGNFYTSQAVTFPISAQITQGAKTLKMQQMVSAGGCASCHSNPGIAGAPGRPYIQ